MKTTKEKAKEVVELIVRDLSGRRGLRHEWDQIDDEIRTEIRREWVKLTLKILEAS